MSPPKFALLGLRALRLAAIVYTIVSLVFLVAFAARFYDHEISSYPADWTSMSGMLGALFAAPLALWSISLVLKSIHLQQQQVAEQQRRHDEMLERENLRLDPRIERVELAADPAWRHGIFGGMTFELSVRGDAEWLCSTVPHGHTPVAITKPSGIVEVVLWKKQPADASYRGFVQYRRLNGTDGWYWISVAAESQNPGDNVPFVLSKVSGPVESEDGVSIEIRYPD